MCNSPSQGTNFPYLPPRHVQYFYRSKSSPNGFTTGLRNMWSHMLDDKPKNTAHFHDLFDSGLLSQTRTVHNRNRHELTSRVVYPFKSAFLLALVIGYLLSAIDESLRANRIKISAIG